MLLYFHESNLKPQQRKQFLLNWHPKYLVCILPLSHCLFGISIKANTTAEQTNSSQAFSHCALNFTICLKCFKVVVFDFHTFKQSYTWRPDLPENCNLIMWFFFCICSVMLIAFIMQMGPQVPLYRSFYEKLTPEYSFHLIFMIARINHKMNI